jgi:hypothetical protein
MIEKIGILGILVVLAFSTGCTMCCHPYDNCGPVYDDSSCGSYCSNVRAGSILENPPVAVTSANSEEVIEESSQDVISTTQPLPATEREPRILSAADLKVGQKAVASKKQTTHRTVKYAGNGEPSIQRW